MTKQSFTPGPWTYAPDGHGAYSIETDDCDGVQICYVRKEGNARLVAVAPALLEELQRTVDFLRSACIVISDANGRRMALEQVKAAEALIARATSPNTQKE